MGVAGAPRQEVVPDVHAVEGAAGRAGAQVGLHGAPQRPAVRPEEVARQLQAAQQPLVAPLRARLLALQGCGGSVPRRACTVFYSGQPYDSRSQRRAAQPLSGGV